MAKCFERPGGCHRGAPRSRRAAVLCETSGRFSHRFDLPGPRGNCSTKCCALLATVGVKMLIIDDEIQHVLAGPLLSIS
jgi:hypothetical protein